MVEGALTLDHYLGRGKGTPTKHVNAMSGETVEIKFRFPFVCHLRSSSEQELDFRIEFVQGDFCVQTTLEKSEPLTPKAGEFKGQYFCTSQSIQFQLRSDNFLKAFQQPRKELRNNDSFKQKIYEISIKVLNRVLRNMRVYGVAPHIYEQTTNIQEAEVFLWHWNTQFRIGNAEWLPVFDKHKVDLLHLLVGIMDTRSGYGARMPEIDAVFKRDIIEAIEDDLEPPPEQEFWVNALEFLHEQNFRMAVVESVIGLEIVLTQYISLFLEKKKKLSKKKIKNFLWEVGLRNRFDVLLRLLAEEKDLASVNPDMVLKTIGWRNDVAHEGKLPDDISNSEVRQGIANVVETSRILRCKIYQIESEPMFQTIVDNVKEKHGLSSVWIYPVTLKKIYMNLTLFRALDEPSSKQRVEDIISFSIQLLSRKIPRFNPQQDLYARIYFFPNPQPVANYTKGELRGFDTFKASIESGPLNK